MTAMAPTEEQRAGAGSVPGGGNGANRSLTPKRQRDAAEVASAAARMLRALSRRAEAGDVQALVCLRDLDRTMGLEQLRAAHGLNVQHGYSWAEIGLACGISRQAAFQRWGK